MIPFAVCIILLGGEARCNPEYIFVQDRQLCLILGLKFLGSRCFDCGFHQVLVDGSWGFTQKSRSCNPDVCKQCGINNVK